jgi:photosystem II stability/assembly factor-like uncharacterized protein
MTTAAQHRAAAFLVLALAACAMGEEFSWKQTGWGGGGYYWACAFHPSKNGVIYMGGDVCGFYKTEDGGKNWRISNAGIPDYAVYSLAVAPSSPDTVYAGTPSGLSRSTDAGEHWEFLGETAKKALAITADRNKSVRAVAVDPSSSSRVFAATPAGKIFRSDDGGRQWKVIYQLKDAGSFSSIAVATANPRVVLAAGTSGVLKSEDGGDTWAELPAPKNASHAIAAPSDAGIIYAACGKEGVHKSADGGKTWAKAGGGLKENFAAREIAVDPKDPNTVYVIGSVNWDGFFYRSTDGGQTWELSRTLRRDLAADPTLPDEGGPRAETAPLSSARDLALNPQRPQELFIAGNWRPCFSPDGGKTWEERDRGADITCVSDIRFFGKKTYVTSMDEGLMVSDDDGATWRELSPLKYSTAVSGHQWRVLVWPKGDTEKILTTCSPWAEPQNRVLVSEDGGKSFRMSRDGLPDYLPTVNTMWGQSYARALAADPKDPDTVYLGMDGDAEPDKGRCGGGIFKSTDGGYTWKQLPNQPASRRSFFALAVDPTDSSRIFWGACANGGGLYRSEDAGATWKHVFKGESWVFNVLVTPGGTIYVPAANLYRSTDHGNTWKQLTKFDYSVSIVGLEVDPQDEKRIWFSRVTWGSGSGGGVYRTTDGGATWQEITGDIPYRKPLVLRYNPTTRELWAGGVGLYKLKQ